MKIMKAFLVLTLAHTLFMNFSFLNSFENVLGTDIEQVVGKKVYLQPGNIQIAKNGIFLNIEGNLIAVNSLEVDEMGVYFDSEKNAWRPELCRRVVDL